MKAIPGELYYRCRGHFLHHKHGDFNTDKAKALAKNNKEKSVWKELTGTVQQDAFAWLLLTFKQIQTTHEIFTSD